VRKIAFTVSVLLTAVLAGCAASAASPEVSSPQALSSQAPSLQAATASTEPSAPNAAASVPPSLSPSPTPAANVISLSEWKVSLPSTMKAGKITFNIDNIGASDHELIAFRSNLDPLSFPQVKGDVDEDGKGIVQVTDGEDIPVGGSQTRTIDLTKPGSYVFMCNIPGHFHQGMYAVVTVTK
jgi:uncharacterized cupredoxin-like copper-binding protein